MKKHLSLISLILTASFLLLACSPEKGASSKDEIVLVSREEGSGTRSAFVELTGILEEKEGEKTDRTSEGAVIQMQTETVIQTVAGSYNSIGYISTGSLSDLVKAIDVDGISPSRENIKNGDYQISRPFLLVYKEESPLIDDFIDFVLSKEAQDIVADSYIDIDSNYSYEASNLDGSLVISGSTSVSPLMEELTEEYMKLNPNINIEIQQPGSSAGIMATIESSVDLGMSSRELKDEEVSQLESKVIALDGIALISNKDNPVSSLSMEEVRDIFMGEITSWSEVK